jgi:hypothetical protein
MSKTPGLALADLAKLSEDVPVGDGHITVTGISISKALDIVKRFPELAKMASGFKVADLLLVAPGRAGRDHRDGDRPSRRRRTGSVRGRHPHRDPVRHRRSRWEVDLQKRLRPFRPAAARSGPVSQIRPLHKGDFYELASGVEELIASGHRPADVWDYTPRQITAFVFLADKRRTRERHSRLADMLAAFNPGDGRELKTQFERWEKDAF